MNPLKNIIVLALALLLSQTAIAVHDIHCLNGEHEQTCEVYFTQDHSASSSASQNQPERIVYGENTDSYASLSSPAIFVLPYLSRAPPRSV